MGKLATATFKGASGTEYSFEVYSIDTSFKNVGAVYIFTRRKVSDGKGSHRLLYIGETSDLGDRIPDHEKWDCVTLNDGNCICILLESDRQRRLDIETDLRNANNTPCNDQ